MNYLMAATLSSAKFTWPGQSMRLSRYDFPAVLSSTIDTGHDLTDRPRCCSSTRVSVYRTSFVGSNGFTLGKKERDGGGGTHLVGWCSWSLTIDPASPSRGSQITGGWGGGKKGFSLATHLHECSQRICLSVPICPSNTHLLCPTKTSMSRVLPCPRCPTTAACRTRVGVSIKEAMNSGEHFVSGSCENNRRIDRQYCRIILGGGESQT